MKRTRTLVGIAAISIVVGVLAYIGAPSNFRRTSNTQDSSVNSEWHDESGAMDGANENVQPKDGLEMNVTADLASDRSGDSGAVAQSRISPDQAQTLAREAAEYEVEEAYSLLLEKLNLTEEQYAAIEAFLVKEALLSGRSSTSGPNPMNEEDRFGILQSILGPTKLKQFLKWEQYRNQFGEAQQFQALLEEQDAPMSSDQRDDFLDVLIAIQEKMGETSGSPDLAPIEHLEDQLDRIDEYERLVIEMAPSLLSAKQVDILFQQYQTRSYDRARVLENHKKAIAAGDEDEPLWYPPRYD